MTSLILMALSDYGNKGRVVRFFAGYINPSVGVFLSHTPALILLVDKKVCRL